jgi:Rv0078B-related antitoxin
MTDTPAHIQKLYTAFFLQKTDAERFCIGFQMIEDGQRMVQAALRRQHPGWSVGQLKVATFRRMYHNDFPPDELDRIATAMQVWHDTVLQ